MKQRFSINIILLFCFTILNSAIALGQYAEFSFDKKFHKFKATPEGEVLKHTFVFENKGDIPLIITNYKVACTCTVVEFPKEPILPGETGEIHVTFDTKGKIGWQYRSIQLFANVKKSPYELELRVKVLND